MSPNTITSIMVLSVSAWLIVCAICDWRKREIPLWLTIVPLIASIIWGAICGNAAASLLAVMMLFITDFNKKPAIVLSILSLAFAIIVSFTLFPYNFESLFPLFIVFGYSLIWYFGKTGGSDAKILITLTLLFGTPAFLYAVIAGGIAGLIGLILKKKQIPLVVPIALGSMVFFSVYLL